MSIADDLLAIVPDSTKEVEVRGVKVKIRPVELTEFARIVSRYPASIEAFKNGFDDIDFLAILKVAPGMIVALIAASLNFEANLEEETKIAKLPDEMKLELVSEILKITMPNGIDDILGKFKPLLDLLGVDLAEM